MKTFRRYLNRNSIGAASVFSALVAGAGFSFLFNVLLARVIGASGVGLYFISTTIIDIGATVSRLGMESAVLRFTAITNTQGDRAGLAALYRRSLGLAVGAAIIIAIPAWLIVSLIGLGGNRAGELQAMLPLVVLSFAPVAVRAIQAEFYKGIGAPGTGTLIHSMLPPLVLLIGGVVLWYLAAIDFQAVMITYVVVAFACMLVGFVLWSRRRPGIWRQQGAFDIRLLLRTSMPLLFVSFGYLAMNWTDILALGSYADPSEVGFYGVARRLTILTTTFVMASVNSVAGPQFAALHAQHDDAALARLARQCTFSMLAATLPVILALLIFPEIVLGFFGPQFEQGAWPLRILALGQLVMIAIGPVETLLIMTGHGKQMRNIIGATAVANVIGNLVLVPSYGAVGAASSTAFCLAAMDVACLLMVRKKLNITTWSARVRRPDGERHSAAAP
ncbi:oligosaccharide flippase family protein [Bradyrhizobium manausense]|uniref:oligosaccharide flippase family protein n=1 Tax=Bradyrhizobium manausense TaxID=989370 RepID=UPI001BAE356E|nr:polysaccharide biosynthesis C-terminal domain-containing protein [Bradyrhizobium manausense]MBR0836725.1 oligosaccharide flippase family protein [Bradyrhizobium manausense]